jgi:virginiamycin B lyase
MRAAVVAGALLLAAPGAASAVTIKEFDLPGNTNPATADQTTATSITAAGGALWAAAPGGIYRIGTDGSTALAVTDGSALPFTIAAGPDGRVWFGEQDDNGDGSIGVFDPANPAGTLQHAPNGDVSEGAEINDITPGPGDGFMWFTEGALDQVARINTANRNVDEFLLNLQTDASTPLGIAAGPDLGVWFTETDDPGAVARLDRNANPNNPDPGFQEFTPPAADQNQEPGDMVANPLGTSLFFAMDNGIGEINTITHAITVHPVPADAQPEQLAAAPDGSIWFTDPDNPNPNSQIGRMDPAGNVQEFGDDATLGGSPEGITIGPDGAIWFTLEDSGQIGRLDPTTPTPTPTPTPPPSATPPPTPSTPPTPPSPTPGRDTTPPALSGLALSARCVRAGSGLSASFDLSEKAHILYSIRHRVGSPVRRRCPATRPHSHGPAGSSVQVGLTTGDAQAGHNVATLARVRRGHTAVGRARRGHNRARIARLVRGLRPGTYQLVVRATDAAGNVSRDRIVRFWVLRR